MTHRPFPAPTQTPRATSARLGWAIVGASRAAARRMIPAIRRTTDGQVLAVHSHNTARAHAFAEAQQIPHPFTDLDQMLARFDIGYVYVGSHPRHHAEGIIAALRAGKHVLCESPLALNYAEAEQLVTMADNRGLTLAINHQLRASPIMQTMRQQLHAERVGQIITVRVSNTHMLPAEQQSWRLHPPGGGVLFDRTIHDVDLVRYLLDDEPRTAAGTVGQQLLGDTRTGVHRETTVEEEVFVHMRMARGGVNVHLHDSFLLPHALDVIEVHGTRGALSAQAWRGGSKSGPGELHFMRSGQRELISSPTAATVAPQDTVMRAFLDATSHRATSLPTSLPAILATGADGLRNLAVTLKLTDVVRRSRLTELRAPTNL